MSLIRVKPLALIVLVTTCHWSQAAELGNMEINSGIDQKLNADIPLNLAPNESMANTRVKIISSKNRNGSKGTTTPQIEINSDDGRLKLTSKAPIEASHLDLVLEVKTDKDTQYKQFTIDLDRASEDSPLIVSPKNNLDKNLAPAQPSKKSYRRKSQANPTAPSNPIKSNPITVEKPSPKPTDDTTNVAAPVTNPALATIDNASTQKLPDAIQFQQSAIKAPSPTETPVPETAVTQPQSWIQENRFTLTAFLTGILGVLILQRLLSNKQNSSTPAQPKKSAVHDKYQALQETLEPDIEQASESNPTINIANDVALFEELLRARMQQLSEANILEPNGLTIQQTDLDDDEFGFDFDLPDFPVDPSKTK